MKFKTKVTRFENKKVKNILKIEDKLQVVRVAFLTSTFAYNSPSKLQHLKCLIMKFCILQIKEYEAFYT